MFLLFGTHLFTEALKALEPTAPAQLPRVQESPAACFEDAHTVTTDNDREDSYKIAIF